MNVVEAGLMCTIGTKQLLDGGDLLDLSGQSCCIAVASAAPLNLPVDLPLLLWTFLLQPFPPNSTNLWILPLRSFQPLPTLTAVHGATKVSLAITSC